MALGNIAEHLQSGGAQLIHDTSGRALGDQAGELQGDGTVFQYLASLEAKDSRGTDNYVIWAIQIA